MVSILAKLLVAAILFAAWMFFVIYTIPNSGSIVSFIQTTLVGLAAHTVLAPTDSAPTQTTKSVPTVQQPPQTATPALTPQTFNP